jgi:hypothetical protein
LWTICGSRGGIILKFENTNTFNFEGAINGMRNPLKSWDMSDSCIGYSSKYHKEMFLIGDKDMRLCQHLIRYGTSDRKFLRQIFVSVDITAPTYWCAELDTYKVATTRNSCSLQHTGMTRDFKLSDFTFDMESDDAYFTEILIGELNKYRQAYIETGEYKYFRMMRQLMPMGYNYHFTWTANYETLANIYFQRRKHKLTEWHEFCGWCETLPYFKEFFVDEQ